MGFPVVIDVYYFMETVSPSYTNAIQIYFRRRRHKRKSLVKTSTMEDEKTLSTVSSALGSQRLTTDEIVMNGSVSYTSNLLPASISSSWTTQAIAIYVVLFLDHAANCYICYTNEESRWGIKEHINRTSLTFCYYQILYMFFSSKAN